MQQENFAVRLTRREANIIAEVLNERKETLQAMIEVMAPGDSSTLIATLDAIEHLLKVKF